MTIEELKIKKEHLENKLSHFLNEIENLKQNFEKETGMIINEINEDFKELNDGRKIDYRVHVKVGLSI